MSEPTWRGKEELRDFRREFLRQYLPPGCQGFVVEDLDLIVRRYGSAFNTDEKGVLFLAELKCGIGTFGPAQRRTLGLLDELCKNSTLSDRYKGFFLIYSPTDNWLDKDNNGFIYVNCQELTQDDLVKWFKGEKIISPISPLAVGEDVAVWSKRERRVYLLG